MLLLLLAAGTGSLRGNVTSGDWLRDDRVPPWELPIIYNSTAFAVVKIDRSEREDDCGFFKPKIQPLFPFHRTYGIFLLTGDFKYDQGGNVSLRSANGTADQCGDGGFDPFTMEVSAPNDLGDRTLTADVPCPPCCAPSRNIRMTGRAQIPMPGSDNMTTTFEFFHSGTITLGRPWVPSGTPP